MREAEPAHEIPAPHDFVVFVVGPWKGDGRHEVFAQRTRQVLDGSTFRASRHKRFTTSRWLIRRTTPRSLPYPHSAGRAIAPPLRFEPLKMNLASRAW